jgi:hypothetical protein
MTKSRPTFDTPQLPAGAKGILPTIWGAFITTVVLALAFSFANVWDLDRTLGVEPHVAPLIGPAVDITAFGLLVVVPWLVLAGASTERLRPANRLMAAAGFLTLALNSAPSAIHGWANHDPRAWGRATVEAIVPFLLIAWSHVGPKLIGLFMDVRERHAAKVAEALRVAEERSVEAANQRAAVVAEAVEEALRSASVDADRRLAEALRQAAAERDALLAVEAQNRADAESAAASVEAELRASTEAAVQRLAQVEAELARLHAASPKRATATSGSRPAPSPRTSTEPAAKAPRRSAAELLEERVEAAKDALPTWQLETPSGPEIRSALGIKSDGVISDIRKRLDADRVALAASAPDDRGGTQ